MHQQVQQQEGVVDRQQQLGGTCGPELGQRGEQMARVDTGGRGRDIDPQLDAGDLAPAVPQQAVAQGQGGQDRSGHAGARRALRKSVQMSRELS